MAGDHGGAEGEGLVIGHPVHAAVVTHQFRSTIT
jgi:hypothetical protein